MPGIEPESNGRVSKSLRFKLFNTGLFRALLLCTPPALPEHPAPGVTQPDQTDLGVASLFITLKKTSTLQLVPSTFTHRETSHDDHRYNKQLFFTVPLLVLSQSRRGLALVLEKCDFPSGLVHSPGQKSKQGQGQSIRMSDPFDGLLILLSSHARFAVLIAKILCLSLPG